MEQLVDLKRRRYLVIGTSVIGAVGVAGLAIPFLSSMAPSARVHAAAAPVRVDVSKLEPGAQVTVSWRSKPVWVLHRTPQNLRDLELPELRVRLRDPDSEVVTQQPDYARNTGRSIKPEYFVAIGLCTHLGCIPTYRPDRAPPDLGVDWLGGYFCPCHGSRYDLAGRVFKFMPAPLNLLIPPYHYVSDTVIMVGASIMKRVEK